MVKAFQESCLTLAGAVVALLFLAGSSSAQVLSIQDDLRARVDEIIRSGDFSQLRDMGPPAVPYVVDYLQETCTDTTFTGGQFSLFLFIKGTEGAEADLALIMFLQHQSRWLRGLGARDVARRKLKEALPELMALLDDRSVFARSVGVTLGPPTDKNIASGTATPEDDFVSLLPPPNWERGGDLVVMDQAVTALEAITGLRVTKQARFDKRAKAWLRWWQKQQESKSEWVP